VGRVFEPVAEHTKLYNELYHGVYLDIYGRLRPLFKKIQEKTGYPE